MGTLKQMLRDLCLDGGWDYAIFWKLKHGIPMVLTWEDAHYKNHAQHDLLGNKFFDETLNKFSDGHYQLDSFELVAAKMSYHVYPLGEGIIGEVAATGKHQWIFADKCVPKSASSFEYENGWKTHFLAGIKTVIFAAVVPHGVVQLGSVNKVHEDLKLVNHIREVFFAYQDPSLPDLSSKSSGVGVSEEMPNVFPSMLTTLDKCSNSSSNAVSLLGNRETVKTANSHVVLDSSMLTGEPHEPVQLKVLDNSKLLEDASGWRDARGWRDANSGSKHYSPFLQNPYIEGLSLYNNAYSANNSSLVDFPHFSPDMFYTATSNIPKFDCVNRHQEGRLHTQVPSDMQLQEISEKRLEVQTESSFTNTSNSSFKYSTSSELLEALGPSFSKQCHYDWEVEMAEIGTSTTIKLPEAMRSSLLNSDSGSDHLLEAVVANIYNNNSEAKSEKSSSKSVQSLQKWEIMQEPSNYDKHSTLSANRTIHQRFPGEQNSQQYLSSLEVDVVRVQGGYSSNCPSTCSEQIDKSSERANINKKRAKPGENCRPRPRDRQLIQDRIKELRELVPSGSKCSIDALLERTIKHMLFLQSISKHADKLKKCAESKLCNMESSIQGSSSFEQGSSWAVEVGSHLKVCTIIVENLNMNGQMLVEMLCEECSHFLEIAEAIRSLGLAILKGVTESHGEKTWICFIVEGQNNRSMHRMDILWSLVKLFQPEATASSHGSATLADAVIQPPF